MATITKLARHRVKNILHRTICVKPILRGFSSCQQIRYAEPYQATKLIPTNESFANPIDQGTLQTLSCSSDEESVEVTFSLAKLIKRTLMNLDVESQDSALHSKFWPSTSCSSWRSSAYS